MAVTRQSQVWVVWPSGTLPPMAGGHSHSHGHVDDAAVEVGRRSRLVLTVSLAVAGLLTVFALAATWPDEAKAEASVTATEFAAPGVTFPLAEVVEVLPACTGDEGVTGADPAAGQSGEQVEDDVTCGALRVALAEDAEEAGATVGISVPPAVTDADLQPGDTVQLMRIPPQDEAPAAYSFLQVRRGAPLALMAILFVLVVGIVARARGLLALLGLGFGGLVVVLYMLPALLEGQSGLTVALVGSSAIMFVVLYLAHGLSVRTSTALAGTLFGVAITAVLGILAVGAARLSGVSDDESATLASFVQLLSPKELLTCAIIVAGLGVLNDVTISQSSSVWELRAAAPGMSRMEIFHSGMRIGRDHIASTIYTIVFAYAGAALPVIMLLFLYERPVLELLQTESLAEEIVRTLASAIGLVLAVPATTAIAAATVGGAVEPDAAKDGPGDGVDPAPRTRAEALAQQRRPRTGPVPQTQARPVAGPGTRPPHAAPPGRPNAPQPPAYGRPPAPRPQGPGGPEVSGRPARPGPRPGVWPDQNRPGGTPPPPR